MTDDIPDIAKDAAKDNTLGRLGQHVQGDGHTGTLMERMGIRIQEVSAEGARGTMPVEGNVQPYGILHGGANVVIAESVGSIGAAIAAGPGRYAVGLDINATHHRSARSGIVTATATALSLGRTLAAYDVVITDDQGRRTCTARITCMLRDQ